MITEGVPIKDFLDKVIERVVVRQFIAELSAQNFCYGQFTHSNGAVNKYDIGPFI